MKKSYFLIFVFVIIFICIPKNVMAKEEVGTCVYSLDTDTLLMDLVSELNLSVTIYDDKSTGDREFTGTTADGDSFYSPLPVKHNRGEVYYLLEDLQQIEMLYSDDLFKKNGEFYKAYEEAGDCPTMQFIYDYNTKELYIYEGNSQASWSGAASINVDTHLPDSNATTYCTLQAELDNVPNNPVIFTTMVTNNGTKQYRIEMNEGSYVANQDDPAIVGNYVFRVREADWEIYWSEDCNPETTPMVLSANEYHDYSNTIIIETTYDWIDREWEEMGEEVGLEDFNKSISCEDIFGQEEGSLGWLLNTILGYIKVIGPILVVLLSAIDFIKAVVGTDEKAMKEAQSKLVIRLICAVGLFLVPTLIQVLLSFINQTVCAL